MQTEFLDTKAWRTRVELSMAIFDWIEVLSRLRPAPQQPRDAVPVDYEKLHSNTTSAA